MTATNVILLPGEAHLITDGAVTRRGILTCAVSKVLPMPHLGVAAVGSGAPSIVDPLLFEISQFGTVAAMRERLPTLLRRRWGLLARILPSYAGFDVVIVGVDQSGESFAFEISTKNRDGLPAFVIRDVEYFRAAPAYEGCEVPAFSLNNQRGWSSKVEDLAIRMIDAQRRAGEDGVRGVGAFVQLTSVYGSGIETRILKTYPDNVGQPIGA